MFTPDVETITVKPVIEDGLSTNPSQLVRRAENRSFRYLYLQDKTIEMAKTTIHLLACVLGPKRSALLIDGCVADVFRACVDSESRKPEDVLNMNQPIRQLDWCGSFMFANEVSADVFLGTRMHHLKLGLSHFL